MTHALADTMREGEKRGLDFVLLDELQKRTGISSDNALKFALHEMLCNALDKDANEITVKVEDRGVFTELTVADNGVKKLSRKEVELILDFSNKASSKRGLLRVSRGYLGNALKCVFGFSYALAEKEGIEPPEIVIASGNKEFSVKLKPDRVGAIIDSDIVERERLDDGNTSLTVRFPKRNEPLIFNQLASVVIATSMVNPTRQVKLEVAGQISEFGTGEKCAPTRNETSVLWYTQERFTSLFEEFMRAAPVAQLKEFISMFRGFTARKIVRKILQEINNRNHDLAENGSMQFFPTISLKDLSEPDVRSLFLAMKKRAKPIGKRSIASILGCVGETGFRKIQQQNGWRRLRYVLLKGSKDNCPQSFNHISGSDCTDPDHLEYPYLVELAVFDRTSDDQQGLQVYECVNFMPSTETVLSQAFDVPYRLGRVRIDVYSPVTVLIHFICPVLTWLNYGKSALDFMDPCDLIKKAFDKLLPIPKTPKQYRPPVPKKPLSWVPHGRIGDPGYEKRLKVFATEIGDANANKGNRMKYSSRGWCYLLEQLGKIHKGEFDSCQKAINDCRKLGLLPIDFVKEDQDETRRFKGILQAADPAEYLNRLRDDVRNFLETLPTYSTDFWTGEQYYLMMVVEKGDLLDLFKPACAEYHVPIVSSKGWPPILLRAHIANLSRKAESKGLTPVLLLFYDHDPAGLKISELFKKLLKDCQKGTGWDPHSLVIDRFGLNYEDIINYSLTWIDNLKTGSGKESRDPAYVSRFGRKKCEANALFRSNDTLRAAQEICRRAIEKYYGPDARTRFQEKEEKSKEKLARVYAAPIWEDLDKTIGELVESIPKRAEDQVESETVSFEDEVEVKVDNRHYGICPRCRCSFNYEKSDIGRLKRCRQCGVAMRFKEQC